MLETLLTNAVRWMLAQVTRPLRYRVEVREPLPRFRWVDGRQLAAGGWQHEIGGEG